MLVPDHAKITKMKGTDTKVTVRLNCYDQWSMKEIAADRQCVQGAVYAAAINYFLQKYWDMNTKKWDRYFPGTQHPYPRDLSSYKPIKIKSKPRNYKKPEPKTDIELSYDILLRCVDRD